MSSTDSDIPVTSTIPQEPRDLWKQIAIAVPLTAIVIFTIGSNLVVLIAFCKEKKLRNSFTYLIANLAVTDFLVGLTSMTFYTLDTVLGYWPFGQFMCGVWIFFDFCMIFASIITLVVISVDRYWAVGWSLHYRKHNKNSKSAVTISGIWIASVAICLPTCIQDRLTSNDTGVCWFDPVKNAAFSYFIAVVGQHLPCIIIIVCYIRVFSLMKKQFKVRPGAGQQAASISDRTALSKDIATASTRIIDAATTSTRTDDATTTSTRTDDAATASTCRDDAATGGIRAIASPVRGQQNKQMTKNRAQKTAQEDKPDASNERAKREKKIFVTMSFVLITYMICWVPFHFIHDLTIIAPDMVTPPLFIVGFWMTYLNSALNPLVYAATYKEFFVVIKGMITCKNLK